MLVISYELYHEQISQKQNEIEITFSAGELNLREIGIEEYITSNT